MHKILGIDLGTNSIGWSIRDTDNSGNQFIIEDGETNSKPNGGVVVFEKGVGEGKSGEYSLAAERRANRSKRRLYNAKRYRKWATLKALSENGMCPLSSEELRLWSIGQWKNDNGLKRNAGRKYPTSRDFHAWLAMDFDKIGKESADEKLKPEYANTYLLRCSLLEENNNSGSNRLYKIGRAFYHLVQRRGFRTSRKSGKSSFGTNEYLEKALQENPDLKASQILQNGLEKDARRIRNSGVIDRKYFVEEFDAICQKQGIDKELRDKIYHAMYFVRPLRSQKGLVGKCTLEKGKTRIPESHPAYEIFRALSFINNIQWRETGSRKRFEEIPMSLKKNILINIFFKKIERGERKGKINDRGYFEFSEIVNAFSENHKYEFNYAPYENSDFRLKRNPNVSACPVIAGLMNVFYDEWTNVFIEDNERYGINFEGLKLSYQPLYNNQQTEQKEKHLDYIGIWHLLFDFLHTKDKEEDLRAFCTNVLGWKENKIDEFCNISISQGYGSLSFTAINKIIPSLEKGKIYSEAVSYANLSNVFEKEFLQANKQQIEIGIANAIAAADEQKELLNITNGLIQAYFGTNPFTRAKGVDDRIKEMAAQDVEEKLATYYGKENWEENRNDQIFKTVLDYYLRFLNGEQKPEEKASFGQKKVAAIDYYKLPRTDEAIKATLKEKFGATDEQLKKMYHPSDIEIYRKAPSFDEELFRKKGIKVPQLESPNPPSRGLKNPMAMRTLHELRKLINYLLEQRKIDTDTKVVVEIARELNDANKRWAIQTYQKYREEENKEFAKAILGVAKEKFPNLNENDADNIDKVRLWWEQLENGEEIYKEVKALKEDVQKYRLWKEQECMCLYTGKMISLVDLFEPGKVDFEHTLYLSKSFDNSLSNLTVCDATYNRSVKGDKIPTELGNYSEEWNGYTAIEPRLKKWKLKVESLKERIENNKKETKRANAKGDIERKNYLVKSRHLLQFDYDYWSKKLKTFTVDEIPNNWKNSQLVDTQIISKYARHYLKTVFNKVDVQKGTITAEFRKIYGIMGDEKKDRSRHTHHFVDAAVLTLVPGSAQREEILQQYYKAKEDKMDKKIYPIKPVNYADFHNSHIEDLKNNILINHITKDQTLNEAKKKIRKRGKVEMFPGSDGKSSARWMQGDAIRGRLHQESFFGAIKPNKRNEQGFAIIEDGKYLIEQFKGEDAIWLVMRKQIGNVNFDKDVIIDTVLKEHLIKQIHQGISKENLKDFNGNIIRHLRCRVKTGAGFLKSETALPIKEHIFKSKQAHKQNYFVQNDENYLYILYEGESEGKRQRGYRILNRFDIAQLKIKRIDELKSDEHYSTLTKVKGKKSNVLQLKAILKVGDRVLLYQQHQDEITAQDYSRRLYKIFKFNEPAPSTAYIYLQHHLEARPNESLTKLEEKDYEPKKYQARIFLSADKFNCLVEHIDFVISPDGEIKWINK